MPSAVDSSIEPVTIVVASHRPGYAKFLAPKLQAVAAADSSVEAIIVADYPVGDLAAAFTGITWIHHPDVSISAKRNIGIGRARGSIIAFTDDDCRPAEGWINAGRDYLAAHPGVAAVEGRTMIAADNTGDGHFREFKRLERPGFRTNNIFYRRSVIHSAGGFDERFTVQREDLDLAFTAIESGGSIDFSESIVAEHRFRPGERWNLLKNCWNRRFDPLLHKKHPLLYRRYVKTPWTPSILVVLAAHGGTVVAGAYGILAALILAADLVLVLGIVMVKRAFNLRNPGDICRAWIGHLLAPVVLAAALVYGNLRFRGKLLG
jgi:GT2 family glycosyltransferase